MELLSETPTCTHANTNPLKEHFYCGKYILAYNSMRMFSRYRQYHLGHASQGWESIYASPSNKHNFQFLKGKNTHRHELDNTFFFFRFDLKVRWGDIQLPLYICSFQQFRTETTTKKGPFEKSFRGNPLKLKFLAYLVQNKCWKLTV